MVSLVIANRQVAGSDSPDDMENFCGSATFDVPRVVATSRHL